ncbi:MAG TPA: hypothetical protein P5323_02085 [Candidatus Moranbacteria bacterium]|jgi:4-aminobutyrate aminotransferase-like enzyme|nr:hypothetical protein [Candidatus Moranbacteria bacterium]HSA08376.1 hypothetical protein [Candidatus Moranbacteria bacterium]
MNNKADEFKINLLKKARDKKIAVCFRTKSGAETNELAIESVDENGNIICTFHNGNGTAYISICDIEEIATEVKLH